jgi:hypothetical protein
MEIFVFGGEEKALALVTAQSTSGNIPTNTELESCLSSSGLVCHVSSGPAARTSCRGRLVCSVAECRITATRPRTPTAALRSGGIGCQAEYKACASPIGLWVTNICPIRGNCHYIIVMHYNGSPENLSSTLFCLGLFISDRNRSVGGSLD